MRGVVKEWCYFEKLLKTVHYLYGVGAQLVTVYDVQLLRRVIGEPPLQVLGVLSRVQTPEVENKTSPQTSFINDLTSNLSSYFKLELHLHNHKLHSHLKKSLIYCFMWLTRSVFTKGQITHCLFLQSGSLHSGFHI